MTNARDFAGNAITALRLQSSALGIHWSLPQPLDSWDCNNRPVLALVCFQRVPAAARGGDWQMFEVACGGFSIGVACGAGLLLRTLPEPPWPSGDLPDPVAQLMADVWDEKFAVSDGLDYGASADDKVAYRQTLWRLGLIWTEPPAGAKSGGALTQAIYPMDATDANLRTLTQGQHGSVADLLQDDPEACGAWLVVLGQNCD